MPTVESLLKTICLEVDAKLKPNLIGIKGIIVRGYLPQAWVFKTQKETVTFHVDRDGKASTMGGGTDKPDVTITADHEMLIEALKTRKNPAGDFKPPKIDSHTSKGRTAFNMLRDRLGL